MATNMIVVLYYKRCISSPPRKSIDYDVDADASICSSSSTNVDGTPRLKSHSGIWTPLPRVRTISKIPKNTLRKLKNKQTNRNTGYKSYGALTFKSTWPLCKGVSVRVSTKPQDFANEFWFVAQESKVMS